MTFELQAERPSPAGWAQTLELAHRYEVSCDDAADHSIAGLHDGQFVIADAQYVDRAKRAGAIVRLEEWHPPASGCGHR